MAGRSNDELDKRGRIINWVNAFFSQKFRSAEVSNEKEHQIRRKIVGISSGAENSPDSREKKIFKGVRCFFGEAILRAHVS